MASEVKANKLSPSSGTDLTLGDASDTVIVPTGATLNIVDGLGVAGGGTGLVSFTAGDVLYATGTTTLAKLAKGTAEQVLAMNSGATAPDWGSVDLTVLPTITVAKGGTNLTSFTAGDVLYATGATTLAKLAKGSAADVLTMNTGATAPEWAAAAGGGKVGQVLYYEDKTTRSTTSSTLNDMSSTLAGVITPTASDSKILVHTGTTMQSTTYSWYSSLYRDIGGGGYTNLTDAGSYNAFVEAPGAANTMYVALTFLDSPSTTSECTYKPYGGVTGSGPLYMNTSATNGTIVVMEILA